MTTPRARTGTRSSWGVGSSSALSFRFDLRSVRQVQRETLQSNDHFALAPPTGGATYGNAAGDKRVLGSLSDDAIALNMMAPVMQAAPPPSPTAVYRKKATKGSGSFAAGAPSEAEAAPQMAPPPKLEAARGDVARMAQALRGSKRQVVVEGYADPADKDKQSASLERANRVREQLIKNGLEPAQVVAVGQGEKAGQAAGVRVVEGDPMVAAPRDEKGATANPGGLAENKDPIGASHFESGSAMTVLRGTSAMISILATKTDGEVVYLYDSESPPGTPSSRSRRCASKTRPIRCSKAARSRCSAEGDSLVKGSPSRSLRARSPSSRSHSTGRSSRCAKTKGATRSRGFSRYSEGCFRAKCSTPGESPTRSTTACPSRRWCT